MRRWLACIALGAAALIHAPATAQQVPCNPVVEFCIPLPPEPGEPAPVISR